MLTRNRLISVVLLFLLTIPCVLADESLRIAGMGGAFVGLHSVEGGVFGNPAGLISVQANNISTAFSAQNLDYENLPSNNGEQMNTKISFRLSPSVYCSRVIRGVGVGLGYIYDLDNRNSTLKVENTKAEYIIDERKFSSDTNTVFGYDFFREKSPVVSLGYSINPRLAIGVRLKYKHQIFKKGMISRPLRLTAVHGTEVNRNDATKLIPAIIDNLDVGDAIERFKEGKDSHEDVIADLSEGGFDLDLGIQTNDHEQGGLLYLRNITAGFMIEHLIQRRIVDPQPSRIRFGIGYTPLSWLATAFDLQKTLDDSGLDLNMGFELSHRWQRWFSGGVIIRSGFAHEASKSKLSLGVGVILGGSQWNYTFVKPLDGSPIRKAAHMFSSTTRF